MLPQETYHHLLVRQHFETRTRREKKAPHVPMDLRLTRVGARLSPFRVLQYATADGCGGQSPGNRRRSREPDQMHACLVHTKKKSLSTTTRPCSSPPKFLVTHGSDKNKSRVYTLEAWWCCWRPTDRLLACLRAKISRRRWTFHLTRKRVRQNDHKLGFCGLRISRSRA